VLKSESPIKVFRSKNLPPLGVQSFSGRVEQMSNKSLNQLSKALTIFLDVIAINLSFLAAYWFRFHSGFFSWRFFENIMAVIGAYREEAPSIDVYIQLMPLMTIIWLAVIRWCKLYVAESQPHLDIFYSSMKVSTLASALTLCSTFFFYHNSPYSRAVVVLEWGLSIGLLWFNRAVVMFIKRQIQRWGIGVSRIAVTGFNRMTEKFISKVQNRPDLGYELVGVIAGSRRVGTAHPNRPKARKRAPKSCKLLGDIADIRRIVEEYHIDELFIASPDISHAQILQIVYQCEGYPVKFRVMPDLFEIMLGEVKIGEVDGIPIIGLKELPLQGWRRLAKRLMDITISLVALIALSPIMLIIALVIKISSKGTVIFKQERIGRDGKPFIMFKFRSMCQDAEWNVGHIWAAEDDGRRTKVGAFLRQWSLDELPQLFNVLKGEMSLVGPRPEMSGLIQGFSKSIPHYLERHQVKSGMTGWAQVHGLRGNTSLEERIKCDLYYIENWSLGFDLKILLKTLGAIGKGN